jgi:predicted Mrr-cat superfamily restriction endonuclease
MKYKYEVEWDGDLSHVRHTQDFETIEEARIALELHNSRNAVLTVKQIREEI